MDWFFHKRQKTQTFEYKLQQTKHPVKHKLKRLSLSPK